MTYPRDSAMALLLSVLVGDGVVVQDGRLALPDPTDAGRLVLADTADLDALEGLGWITVTDAGATVTERGLYWVRRWLVKRPEFRRLATVRELSTLGGG